MIGHHRASTAREFFAEVYVSQGWLYAGSVLGAGKYYLLLMS